MLKGERTRLQRYAIESTPARVYEGCCTWFTILVLSAQCNQQGRRRTQVRRFCVSGSFGKLAFQSSRACEKGPLGPSAVADCSRTHRDVRGPRPSKSRPALPQPTRHSPSHPKWPTHLSAAGCVGRPAENASPSQPICLCAT